MKRTWIKTAVLFTILVAGAGYAYKFQYLGGKAKEESEKKAKKLFVFSPSAVSRVTLTRKGETVDIKRESSGWKITSPLVADGDQGSINSMLEAAADAQADSSADGEPKDFGLEPPALQADFYAGAKPETLTVGTTTPTRGSVYVRSTNTGGKIMLAPLSLLNDISKSLFQLRDKRLLKGLPSEITKIEMEKGPMRLVLEKTDKWRMSGALTATADEREAENLVSSLMFADAVEFADGLDAAKTGLGKPALAYTLWKGSSRQKILFGSDTPDKTGVYAKAEGGTAVAVLPGFMYKQLPSAPEAFLEKKEEKK